MVAHTHSHVRNVATVSADRDLETKQGRPIVFLLPLIYSPSLPVCLSTLLVPFASAQRFSLLSLFPPLALLHQQKIPILYLSGTVFLLLLLLFDPSVLYVSLIFSLCVRFVCYHPWKSPNNFYLFIRRRRRVWMGRKKRKSTTHFASHRDEQNAFIDYYYFWKRRKSLSHLAHWIVALSHFFRYWKKTAFSVTRTAAVVCCCCRWGPPARAKATLGITRIL